MMGLELMMFLLDRTCRSFLAVSGKLLLRLSYCSGRDKIAPYKFLLIFFDRCAMMNQRRDV